MAYTQQDSDKFAFNEMFTHIPICSHPKPKDILILKKSSDLMEEINRHIDINVETKESDKKFDIILCHSKVDSNLIENIYENLKDDGILVLSPKSFIDEKDVILEELEELSKAFKIVMPYRVENSIIRQAYFIFASKKYHPTADIILQKSELIDDLHYYTSNIHLSCFELPKYVYEEIKDITKR